MSVPTQKLKSFATALAAAGTGVVILGLAYLFLVPKTYRASTLVKIIDWVQSRDLDHPSDLNVVSTECNLIRSEAFLDQVIQNLGLADSWAKRYHISSAADMRSRLLSECLVYPLHNSTVVAIRVTSDDRKEASRIANEFARVYISFTSARREKLISTKLGGLKQEWNDQAENIRSAQSNLDSLYFQIVRTRATNKTQFYDDDSFDQIVKKRIETEGQFVAQQDEYNRLVKMKPDERVQVLSSMDADSPLNAVLLQLAKTKNQLLKANLDQGPDSREVKDATLTVENLNKKIAELASSAMSVRQTQLRGLSSAIEQLKQKLQNASTNVATVKVDDANYQAALSNLNSLKAQRAGLAKKMADEESAEASRPAGITTEVIERAEPPSKPFTPDGQVALFIIGTGSVLVLASLVLFLIGKKSEALAANAAKQTA